MKKYFLSLLLLFLIKSIYGQEGAAVPTLALQQSPLLFGAGWIGVAIPINDAAGFYYNPAQLGYFSQENSLSLFNMPQNTEWIPNYFSNFSFQSFSMALGHNFIKNDNNLPLSIGVGYLHNKFDYRYSFDPKRSYDAFDCFSVGASYDYYLRFNLGMSVKSFTSILGSGPTENGIREFKTSGTAFDFGTMITTPISKLFFNNYKIDLNATSILKPKVNFTLGYSFTNFGKEIYYIDPAQSDPIPRTARLGYSFNFAIELSTNWAEKLNVIDYSFTAEAEDILIKRDSLGKIEYQNLLGDIKFKRHLIELKGNEFVVIHRGHILRLFETLIIVSGRLNGRGYDNRRISTGLGFSSEGLFKFLNAKVDNSVINYLTNHFVLEYYETNIFVNTNLETNLKGIVLNYKGIEF